MLYLQVVDGKIRKQDNYYPVLITNLLSGIKYYTFVDFDAAEGEAGSTCFVSC